MKYLLDTGVFLWALDAFEKLNQVAQDIFLRNTEELYLSAASSWEIAIKCSAGKLELPGPPPEYVPSRMSLQNIRALPITHVHALAVTILPMHHKDPFDRLLIAQARAEQMVLMTADQAFRKYDVQTIWCAA